MSNPARILVIEDNATNRELMAYLLRAFGYQILEASDGESGVESAQREKPDLIICDVHLPKLDGYGVVKKLKTDNALRAIPVVAVTALAMVGDRDRILAAGFDGYVSKPISPETFVQDVEKFLGPEQRAKFVRKAPAEVLPAKKKPVASKEATVLVIDDVVANIEFARSTLEPSGYRVLAAGGVKRAVEMIKSDLPDLVLCDLHMHPQSGYAMLELARTNQALQEIPIVIISSTVSGDWERLDCLKLGAAQFIRRPIEPEALLEEIALALKRFEKSV